MKEQETLITEINIDFKCTKCGNTAQCSILNAITLGAPMCMDCDEEMEQKPIYVKNKPTKKEKKKVNDIAKALMKAEELKNEKLLEMTKIALKGTTSKEKQTTRGILRRHIKQINKYKKINLC